jgi:hypothetical protein
MAETFRELALRVQWQQVEDGRANAVGTWDGTGDGRSLMLNGHMDTDTPTVVVPLWRTMAGAKKPTSTPINIQYLDGGSNDLAIGTPAATVYASLMSCATQFAAKGPGSYTIIATPLPRNDATFETNRQALRALLLANGNYPVCDQGGQPEFVNQASSTNTTYFEVGLSVHLRDAGYNRKKAYAAESIAALLGSI